MADWESYEKAANKGPWPIFWKIILTVVGMVIVLSVIGYGLGWFGEAAKVAQDEFGATAALKKYEWFINTANAIEKMDKDLKLFEGRVQGIDGQYKGYGSDMAKWPPHIQIQYNRQREQARDDLIAIASQRNNLVKEYNAASDKFNWKLFQTRPDKPKERFHDYAVPQQ